MYTCVYIYIYIYVYIHLYTVYSIYVHTYIPQTVSAVGVLAVYLRIRYCLNGDFRVYARQLLLTGCGDREGQVAPVYAKSLAPITFSPPS